MVLRIHQRFTSALVNVEDSDVLLQTPAFVKAGEGKTKKKKVCKRTFSGEASFMPSARRV